VCNFRVLNEYTKNTEEEKEEGERKEH